jgi:cytochrome c-type biogenesis protein CcmH/NrfG
MTSIRKLEEEIARTSDEQVRRQLQELINKRKQRREQVVGTIKGRVESLFEDNRTPAQRRKDKVVAYCVAFVALIVVIAVLVLAWCYKP